MPVFYGQGQLSRTVAGVFYATDFTPSTFQASGSLTFNSDLLNTNSASFQSFADNVEVQVC